MNARSYWKQDQSEIPEDKTPSLSTRDATKHSMSDDLILYCKQDEEGQDGYAMPNFLFLYYNNLCKEAISLLIISVPTKQVLMFWLQRISLFNGSVGLDVSLDVSFF